MFLSISGFLLNINRRLCSHQLIPVGVSYEPYLKFVTLNGCILIDPLLQEKGTSTVALDDQDENEYKQLIASDVDDTEGDGGQTTVVKDDNQKELEKSGRGAEEEDLSELNEFQRRRKLQQQRQQQQQLKLQPHPLPQQEQQESGPQQGIKRTNTGTEKLIQIDEKNEKSYHHEETLGAEVSQLEGDSFMSRRMQHKLQLDEERQQRRDRETADAILRRIAPSSFKPDKEVKGTVFKQRYVNQIFVRGDNIVMVAYERPEDMKKITRLKSLAAAVS